MRYRCSDDLSINFLTECERRSLCRDARVHFDWNFREKIWCICLGTALNSRMVPLTIFRTLLRSKKDELGFFLVCLRQACTGYKNHIVHTRDAPNMPAGRDGMCRLNFHQEKRAKLLKRAFDVTFGPDAWLIIIRRLLRVALVANIWTFLWASKPFRVSTWGYC